MAKKIGIVYWDARNICPPPPTTAPPLEGAIDDSMACNIQNRIP